MRAERKRLIILVCRMDANFQSSPIFVFHLIYFCLATRSTEPKCSCFFIFLSANRANQSLSFNQVEWVEAKRRALAREIERGSRQ